MVVEPVWGYTFVWPEPSVRIKTYLWFAKSDQVILIYKCEIWKSLSIAEISCPWGRTDGEPDNNMPLAVAGTEAEKATGEEKSAFLCQKQMY